MRTPDFSRLEALAGSVVSVSEMPGGASTRRYFRVSLPGKSAVAGSAEGGTAQTMIAMFVPEGGKPEEIAKETARQRWPFLEVRDLLHASDVDVPALYAEDQANGWLLLEDLGDDTLANYLVKNEPASPRLRERLYRRAVTDLARAQIKLAELPKDSIVATRAFDADLLRWEIDHFREWGLEARGHHLSADDRTTFDEIASRLAARIASWPRGFVHRDYQSRNLMVRPPRNEQEESLCWIDFQDALLGPRVYDLVALLNDSYQTFDREFVLERLNEYAAAAGFPEGREEIIEQFDYVTVQRKLKDAGRFVFIERMKGNDSFLRFVTPTIRKVSEALGRLSSRDTDMKALQSLLNRTLPQEFG
jgi:aminoglycoside/choline kinase family phosphotransferase